MLLFLSVHIHWMSIVVLSKEYGKMYGTEYSETLLKKKNTKIKYISVFNINTRISDLSLAVPEELQ